MILLEASLNKGELKIGIKNPGHPISSYRKKWVSAELIQTCCRNMFAMLKRKNRIDPKESLEQIMETGRILGDELLPPEIKKELRYFTNNHLLLDVDDHLVHIPWELICIGDEFLCQQFDMGRNVQTRQYVIPASDRNLKTPLAMWIVTNPKGDLDSADLEGERICDEIDAMNREKCFIRADQDSDVSPELLQQKLRGYDVLHFAGHANYVPDNPGQSGWELKGDTYFKATDVKKMEGGAAMPFLVFSNACQSARTEAWDWKDDVLDDSFGLANAFMLAGVKHYIGTSWEITDEPGSKFAHLFYRNLLSGCTIGNAVRKARQDAIHDGSDISWASYVLYGDPTFRYFNPNSEPELSDHPIKQSSQTNTDEKVRSLNREKHKEHGNPTEHRSGNLRLLFLSLAVIILTGALLASYFSRNNEDSWTSTPLSLAVVFDPESFSREKEQIIQSAIETKLLEFPRIQLVDRTSLNILLNELKLNSSQWIAEDRKIDPGLLPANLFLFIKVSYSDPKPLVLMRLKDTRTGSVIDVLNEPFRENESILTQKEALSQALLIKLKELYPLQGIITEISEQGIEINIGHEEGVQIGQKFRMLNRKGELTVIAVQAETSIVRMEPQSSDVNVSDRVEMLKIVEAHKSGRTGLD